MLLDEVRQEVLEACGRPENLLTPSFYQEHLRVVVAHATSLAPALGADVEVVELAAWLHDLSAVLDLGTLPTHAEASADLAGGLLARHGCPDPRIAAVASAIRRHSQPLGLHEGTAEEVCLSNADASAQIAAPAFWLYFAFRVRKLSFADGRAWYAGRLRQNWAAMIPQARALVEAEYARALELVG